MINKTKRNIVIVCCLVLSIMIASIAIIIEHNHKQPEAEISSESETIPTPTSNTEEPERVFANQVHYIAGWDRCLDQLCIDSDVVFMGDSITYQSQFEVEFPDLTICNLSLSSETIKGINYRVGTLQTVKPEKVFLLIGINSLKNHNINTCVEDYITLVDNIKTKGDFDLYLISVTPIAKNDSGVDDPSPETIVSFNDKIAEIANKVGATYIDLHSRFVESGYIKPKYTKDGLHLSEEAYEVWTECVRPYIEEN